MIKIKITLNNKIGKDLSIFNFTNTQDNIYNSKKYYINSKIDNPDFWFINENIWHAEYEEVDINPKNIFFINSETIYPNDYFLKQSKIDFLNQFSRVYSPKAIYLSNVVNTPPFLPWSLRGSPYWKREISDIEYYKNLYPDKKKLISVYSSDKDISEHQKLRINFLKNLQKETGDLIDFYGTGFKPTKIKEKGILDYKYHIVIENNTYKNLISEKLYDSFLGLSYPIYSGATNLGDYFSKKSFTFINIEDFNGTLKAIENIIKDDFYESRVKDIEEARNIVLNKFNLIKRIDEIVESKTLTNLNFKKNIKVYNKKNFENNYFLAKLIFKLDSLLVKISRFLKNYYT